MSELWRNSVVVAALVAGSVALIRMWVDRKLTSYKAELDGEFDAKLEKVKGEIRKDVERDLKYQESRLRVAAEIELRQHDRQWAVLERVTRAFQLAAAACDDACTSFLVANARGIVLTEWSKKTDFGHKLRKLTALVPTVPDPFLQRWVETLAELELVRTSIAEQLETLSKGRPSDADREWVAANMAHVERAHKLALAIRRDWGNELRRANTKILEDLRSRS